MAYIARTDGARENIPASTNISLEYAREIVGGYVERVAPKFSPDVIFLCNEDGHVKRLPFNAHGGDLYGYGPIVGDIIVMSRAEARKHKWL